MFNPIRFGIRHSFFNFKFFNSNNQSNILIEEEQIQHLPVVQVVQPKPIEQVVQPKPIEQVVQPKPIEQVVQPKPVTFSEPI